MLGQISLFYTVPSYSIILIFFSIIYSYIDKYPDLPSYTRRKAIYEIVQKNKISLISQEKLNDNESKSKTESFINKIKSRFSFFTKKSNKKSNDSFNNEMYDIALSFAGEDRKYAEAIAAILYKSQIKVFYDKYEQDTFWGKNLYQHLQKVYRDSAKFCVIIISSNYAKKLWTRHELEQAQARAFKENSEYILPLRIDNTEIPGLNETIGYIDLNEHSIKEVCSLLIKKIRK